MVPYHFVFDSGRTSIAEAAISIQNVPVAADLLCIGVSPYLQQVSCCNVANRSPCYTPKLGDLQSFVLILWLHTGSLHVTDFAHSTEIPLCTLTFHAVKPERSI